MTEPNKTVRRNAGRLVCAIGDVHGEADKLRALHEIIFEHHAANAPNKRLVMVHLGDYVDRGPDSYGVIEMIRQLEARDDIETITLRGNHEQMMLDAMTGSQSAVDFWCSNGGVQTLESYHRAGHESVPSDHVAWLAQLPTLQTDPALKLIFVHAGIDPHTYPDENEKIYLWTRSPRFHDTETWDNPRLDGWTVVHGHTPTDDSKPDVSGTPPGRINLDTGAVYGGQLTAAIFDGRPMPTFLKVC